MLLSKFLLPPTPLPPYHYNIVFGGQILCDVYTFVSFCGDFVSVGHVG